MPERKPSKQLFAALKHLEKVVDSDKQTGDRLPTTPELARDASVSVATMWKAVHKLKQQGRLFVAQRSGIRIAAPAMPVSFGRSATPARENRSAKLLQQIDCDILAGAFPAGMPLPHAKYLRQRYGAGHRTLMRVLSQSTLLEPYKRGYRVPCMAVSEGANRIIAIAAGNITGALEPFTVRSFDMARLIEQECTSRRIIHSTIGYDYRAGRLRPLDMVERVTADRRFGDTILGTVISTVGIPRETIEQVVGLPGVSGKPVALIDETGSPTEPWFDTITRGARLFSVSNSPQSGAGMGRYLLSLGHRNAVYLSPFHGTQWSQNRLAGLVRVIEGAGGTVLAETIADPAITAQRDPGTMELAGVVANSFAAPQRSDEVVWRSRNQMISNIDAIDTRLRVHDAVVPLVGAALRHTGATVLVCANDAVAIEAMSLLLQHGINVPADISVVGFDDSIESFTRQLTTYNFNSHGLVQAVFSHILHPSRVAHVNAKKPLEIEGMIVDRGSAQRNVGRTKLKNASVTPVVLPTHVHVPAI